ncbi:Gfo/Idh/MocA family oxidoreductase [Sphingobacterium sp. UT-1RO-CII-1]|uniref:Gfo/Idh/MocA family oxidoreductase n=1 Tax=Sphingobacterium sp. UT-1RO-CII-1 TaxID=2995225 RepID=UPI00227A5FD5|nr:Gfo/Idh/MocA family oxidoreductase [Sphingobacterium sp. UT-1RO-CII-1]MCY4778495.1 Gfo/Idh/MocA family oxidoreductase [Sphingobacterium sp. UT-1RO-CII-1]
MNHYLSRRSFIKKSAMAGGAVAFSNSLLGNVNLAKPNERVNLACIGIGNRGGEIIRDLYKTGLCNVVALCDVDMGGKHTQDIMKTFPDVPRFQDFRKMFDQMGGQIDAVSIGTPDFAHFAIAMLAMDLGIHVYVEKPMAQTFWEIELMTDKARRSPKVVTQMGNQGHSEANYFQFKTWKDAGIIKDVNRIDAHMNMPRRWHGWDTNIKGFPYPERTPETLDWDLWQMQTLGHDYNKDFVNGQWRCWYDFGMGALGDWGAHLLDTAHEFLELGLPTEIEAVRLDGHNSFFFPMSSTLRFHFPKRKNMPAVDVNWYDGIDNLPPIPEGYGVSGLDPNIPPPSTGKIEPVKLNPGKIIYSKDLIFKGGSHASTLQIIPENKAKDMANKLPEVPKTPSNHFANFLKACKGEEKTRSSFEVAGQLSQVFSLGVIAQRLNSKFTFDPQKKEIVDDKFANALLAGPAPAKGWEQFYKM